MSNICLLPLILITRNNSYLAILAILSTIIYHVPMNDALTINGKTLTSRLFLGTGKFSSPSIMAESIQASGAEVITAALRRVNLDNPKDSLMSHIDPKEFVFLPNTSGARNAEEAVRLAELVRFSGVSNWIKLEVTPEPKYLLPDPIETLKAAEALVKRKFVVLPYIQADPILAKQLEEIGCATVMPLGSPIGTNQGIRTREFIEMIIENARIPVVVDAGLGAPSHAAMAMELGADAVLVNTAIATAAQPVQMAAAFKKAVEAGRAAYLSGLPTEIETASPSSPLTGFLR